MYKRIGVILCKATESYQQSLLKGISTKAHSLGYDVCVFTNFEKQCFHENYELGERNIFNLVSYESFDGIIVAGDTLKMRGIEELLFPRFKECSCPVIFVDYTNDLGIDNITTDDTHAFEEIIDHLIEEHDCQNILFYSGPEEVSSSRMRFRGYKNSLEKHNIPLREEYYSFEGNFWYQGGEQVAKEIIEGRRPRPDAIAFCGDYMAIGALQEFTAHGWQIPKDIILTGFDAVLDGLKCNPPLTSYSPDIVTTGTNAVLALHSKINPQVPYHPLSHRGFLAMGGSCGCPENFNYTKKYFFNDDRSQAYEDFLGSNMLEDLADTDSLERLMEKITFFLFLVPDWHDFHLCLCDNWLQSQLTDASAEHIDGYTDTMIQLIESKGNSSRLIHEPFSVKEMLPALHEEHDFPQTYYFIPLHMNQHCFGYTVLSYGRKIKTFDINYHNWTKHICNALEHFRIQTKLTQIASKDPLTGVYTRIGLKQNLASISYNIAQGGKQGFLLVADLDNLKAINDTIGHQTGDIAIREFAHILLSLKAEDELCVRTGGDEFVVIGYGDYDEESKQAYINNILTRVENSSLAKSLKLPFSASLGAVVKPIASLMDYEDLYQQADSGMYSMKDIHHKNQHI